MPNAKETGDWNDEFLQRIRRDAEMVGNAYEMGKSDGAIHAYRACAEALRVQADLCDRGVAPTADLLRVWGATWEHEIARLVAQQGEVE